MFTLQFSADAGYASEVPAAVEVSWNIATEGLLCGFAWWFRIRVGAGAPGPGFAHGWKQAVQYLGEERPVNAGSLVRVRVAALRDEGLHSLRFQLLEPANAPPLPWPVPEPLASLAARMPRGASLPVQNYHFTMLGDAARRASSIWGPARGFWA